MQRRNIVGALREYSTDNKMNPNQLKFLERLIANAQAELAMATNVRDLERVSILTKRIEGYRDKIKEMSK